MPTISHRSTSPVPTLADECNRRNECRYGLKGVRMRHVPTDREFDCGGSKWSEAGNLLLYTRDEIITKDKKEPDEHGSTSYNGAKLCAVEFEPYQPHEIVRA